MSDSWKDDNCAAIKAHYAVLSIPKAAALWCGVPDDRLEQVLSEVTPLSPTGMGRSVWCHSEVPCLEPRSRAIAEAIESGELPHGREDASPVEEGNHVAYERRHFFGRDLKAWMEKAFPNEKPEFLFDDIEQNSHSSISAESYRALKAERDSLQKRLDNGIEEFKKIREEKTAVEAERDALKYIADKVCPERGAGHLSGCGRPYWRSGHARQSRGCTTTPRYHNRRNPGRLSNRLQDLQGSRTPTRRDPQLFSRSRCRRSCTGSPDR